MSRNHHSAVFILTFLLALAAYLATLAPDLTWQHWGSDGGELITAAVTLGIPHPPGYPTYILLGNLFHRLSIGPVAFRFNLFSALSIALAAGLVSVTGIRHTQNIPQADPRSASTKHHSPFTINHLLLILIHATPGLVLAFSPLVWSQAVITEVYGLNLLCLAAFLWALSAGKPFLAGLLFGLSLTTHLASALLMPLALALTPRRRWRALGGGLLTGLAPLLALPWLARGTSPVVWGNPTTLSGWWWLISGRIYHANALALPLSRLGPRLLDWGRLLLVQFSLAGVPLLLFSVIRRHRPGAARHRAGWLLATAVLIILYAIGYNTPDAAVLLLPALLLLAVLLAPALYVLRRAALLLPLALFLLNFHGQTLRQDPGPRAAAQQLLQNAAPDAILITPGNATIFTLWYLQHVEAQRPDLVLVDANLFAFSWYRTRLGRQYPDLRHLAEDDLAGFVQKNGTERPVAYVDLDENRRDAKHVEKLIFFMALP